MRGAAVPGQVGRERRRVGLVQVGEGDPDPGRRGDAEPLARGHRTDPRPAGPIRMSVGVELAADLITDIDEALKTTTTSYRRNRRPAPHSATKPPVTSG
jgi:hypothetical protein